ncbi:hypothetical protein V5O48_013297 [Marasmius crinis-equi]|uniref:HMG domain-containing protein n=1 Tax=Marasmius crinis-equi TaxID=585013 RepID=A0ABR3F0U4_9AGAR
MSAFDWGPVYSNLNTEGSSNEHNGVWRDLQSKIGGPVDGNVGNDAWRTWEKQNHGGSSSLRNRESPTKKRYSRKVVRGGRRGGRRKEKRGTDTEHSQVAPNEPEMPTVDMGDFDDRNDLGGYGGSFEIDFSSAEEQALEDYISHFQSGAVEFIPIGTFLYVVQGWNASKREPNDKWYHFQGRPVGEDVYITCMCPAFLQKQTCVHRETYIEFRKERFCEVEGRMFRDGRVVWFWRELDSDDPQLGGRLWLNRFSVKTGRDDGNGVARRALVTFLGSDAGIGKWTCSQCSSGCSHYSAAQNFFCEVLGIEQAAELERDSSDNDVVLFGDSMSVSHSERSISYLPIRPPYWAELPTDCSHYPRPSPASSVPSRIGLTNQSTRALCGLEISITPDLARTIKGCTVYALTESLTCEIELVQCPVCPHRKHCFIGPEPRNLGLFNYNNGVLFTHELLDDYTSRFTSSETPFVSFVEAMGRVYEGRGCNFVKEDLFRSVWFAYVNIQDFSHDMCCTKCGDAPESLIWDGVTLAFGRKHLSESLTPPTLSGPNAPIRPQNYPKRPQIIQEDRGLPLRRLIRNWVKKAQLKKASKAVYNETDDEDEENGNTSAAPLRLEDFEVIVGRLMLVSQELAVLFKRVFSLHATTDSRMKRLYGVLFEQIAAEEYALQMLNARSLPPLQEFTEHPCWAKASKLIDIPALYNLLEAEYKSSGRYPRDLLDVSGWLLCRATGVLEGLSKAEPVPLQPEELQGEDDWRKGAVIAFGRFATDPYTPASVVMAQR